MALNDLTRQLMLAVARDNDLNAAKKIIQIMCENEKSASNKRFCQNIQNYLHTSSLNIMEVPADLTGMLIMEDVSVSFQPARYWVSERELQLSESLISLHEASDILRQAGVNFRNAALLYGLPGTGKTEFGRYLAWKMNKPFAYLKFSSLIDSYLGKTAKNLTKVFDYIEKTKCVFMLDELDAISEQRGSAGEGTGKKMDRVVITLIQCLDKLSSVN